MNQKEIANAFRKIAGEQAVREMEPMSCHTTFRVGGPADFYISPKSEEEIKDICEICRKNGIPVFVCGNGSNLVVSDEGFRGVILSVYKNFQGVEQKGQILSVRAGTLLSTASCAAREASLTGMEFASGIPGTIGGAVRMNAGAYGGEMKDIVERVRVLTADGNIRTLQKEEVRFGYRSSVIKEEQMIVLGADFLLTAGEKKKIQETMQELKKRRTEKQPLEYPSAGSAFKRPEGYFAGKLIMDTGLAGFSVGGAAVSAKHCGFLINLGNASASDVYTLMQEVQRRVWEKFRVELEPEIQFLGRF